MKIGAAMTAFVSVCAGFGSTGCTALFEPLETVESVDIERYVGKWYEIARYPFAAQAGCTGTTADYTLRDDGRVTVLNTCYVGSLDGEVQTIEGTARVVDEETNAKLAVSFFAFFEGPYWIIDLDPDYQWAVVGTPIRTNLWILSRTPTLDEATYNDILTRLPDKGFDPARLELTEQPSE
ncbi:MAG: lipocalin family protein [Phycisphaerae bacterium]